MSHDSFSGGQTEWMFWRDRGHPSRVLRTVACRRSIFSRRSSRDIGVDQQGLLLSNAGAFDLEL